MKCKAASSPVLVRPFRALRVPTSGHQDAHLLFCVTTSPPFSISLAIHLHCRSPSPGLSCAVHLCQPTAAELAISHVLH
ncbi:RELT-like protein 2 [Frankliniella fusca]|uniref:RELT-like protein 2 n=1 Tax=Frankliniella fusca TaxID=407009 RepID=A0AAE1HNM6_9NEOP|nr:RELT-like protein 2 [Frankliniella fusca]